MKFLNKLLFVYSFIFVLAIVVINIRLLKTVGDMRLLLLFFTLFLYFIFVSLQKLRILSYFSTRTPFVILRIALFSYGLCFTSLLVIANAFSIHHISDVKSIFAFLPIFLYFGLQTVEGYRHMIGNTKLVSQEKVVIPDIKQSTVKILKDKDNYHNSHVVQETRRRHFLKLLSGTSLGLVLLYFFGSKSAGASFFGSIPGPGTVAIKDTNGNKIDPAIKLPLDGYGITNIDDSNYPHYYGFVDKDGNWYILKENNDGTYRYCKGSSSFVTNWTGRAGQTYGYFDSIF